MAGEYCKGPCGLIGMVWREHVVQKGTMQVTESLVKDGGLRAEIVADESVVDTCRRCEFAAGHRGLKPGSEESFSGFQEPLAPSRRLVASLGAATGLADRDGWQFFDCGEGCDAVSEAFPAMWPVIWSDAEALLQRASKDQGTKWRCGPRRSNSCIENLAAIGALVVKSAGQESDGSANRKLRKIDGAGVKKNLGGRPPKERKVGDEQRAWESTIVGENLGYKAVSFGENRIRDKFIHRPEHLLDLCVVNVGVLGNLATRDALRAPICHRCQRGGSESETALSALPSVLPHIDDRIARLSGERGLRSAGDSRDLDTLTTLTGWISIRVGRLRNRHPSPTAGFR